MSRCTGIELGPDYCAIVGVRRLRGGVEVERGRFFGSPEWPGSLSEQATLLRTTRVALGLPRDASVVVWAGTGAGLSPSSGDPDATGEEPAGFHVRTVLTPAEALLHLAARRSRPAGEQAVAWLALHRHGGAIAIVEHYSLLHSREFAWRISAPEERAQAHLLRRYLVVAQLLPYLRESIETVQRNHGTSIQAGVACGTLPDLRSLTMPLIEELDIEIETLDAPADWFDAAGEAGQEGAPPAAMQLAQAAAARSLLARSSWSPWLRRVAVLVLALGAAWCSFVVWSRWAGGERESQVSRRQDPAQRSVRPAPPLRMPQPGEAAPARDSRPVIPRDARLESTIGIGERVSEVSEPPPDTRPVVAAILIAPDRRLAVVNGSVVGVSGRVGPRVVVGIEPDGVVFREPSDREIRIRISRPATRPR